MDQISSDIDNGSTVAVEESDGPATLTHTGGSVRLVIDNTNGFRLYFVQQGLKTVEYQPTAKTNIPRRDGHSCCKG